MIDASDNYWSKRATLNFNNQTVDATLAVTEEGQPIVELDNEVPQNSEPDGIYKVINGTTLDGADVTLKHVLAVTGYDSGSGHKIRSIKRVQEIEIDGIGGDPFIDEEVIIHFDLLCFLPNHPIINKDEISIIERGQWEAVGEFADQINEREEYIKSRCHPLRTATITLTQNDQNGPPRVQIKKAQSRIENILNIASFLLGTGCTSFRVEIKKGDDTYIRAQSTHRNIGSAFRIHNLVWNDLPELIDTAYDWYASKEREDYNINRIIGYYLDSINITRTVDGQLSTLFNGIELFAKRYSDYGPQFSSTPKRLEFLVNQLDVEVEDLARHSRVFPDKYIENIYEPNWYEELALSLLSVMRLSSHLSLPANLLEQQLIRNEPIPEYFYSKTRQYIVHGDNQSTFSGRPNLLVAELDSSRVFMQRLIRNQLFGDIDSDSHIRLGNLDPASLNHVTLD